MSSEETSASAAYSTPNTDSDRRIQGNRHETNTGEIENRTIDNKDKHRCNDRPGTKQKTDGIDIEDPKA